MFSGKAQVSRQVCHFYFLVSSVCLLMRVTMVDKNKAVVCCLLATSAIMLSEKKKRKCKMWSKKWYLKRNVSCDADLLNELLKRMCLEMMPSSCRQVNWGNCGISWVNCAVLCVKDDWKDKSEAWVIACQNCAVYPVFPSGIMSHSKIVHFNWECVELLTVESAEHIHK